MRRQTTAESRVAEAPVVDGRGRVIRLLLRADMAPLDLLPEPGAVKEAIELARRPVSEVMLQPGGCRSPRHGPAPRGLGCCWTAGLPGLPVTDEAGVLIGFISAPTSCAPWQPTRRWT